ncbi:MAG: SDR family NAD(P)-dependent oxidoreductase, partial [Jatrophihabitans sp.]|uniref:SDR family NAD(P)-dependent oxidoreductase n=1 Tax=Jatrophihabitans sp. TaxID=1932789 RepID=UPI003F7F9AF3
MHGLEGLRALVTGGASGIGRATVQTFLDHGVRVAALDLIDTDVPDAYMVRADLADDRTVRQAVLDAVQALGGLAVLVNNAGIGAQGGLEENDDSQW